MHQVCEIVMPPTEDVEKAVAEIMAPFDENNEDEDTRSVVFWDWYTIGGRWSGSKVTEHLDQDKIKNFYAELKNRKVTVSGVQWGKQEISPESQIPMVDSLWVEHFPGWDHCPLFGHAGKHLAGDIMRYVDVNPDQKCARLIIAGLNHCSKLCAQYMTQREFWNGVTHIDSAWDGKIVSGVAEFSKYIESWSDEFGEKRTVKDDWLVVTVDYHS